MLEYARFHCCWCQLVLYDVFMMFSSVLAFKLLVVWFSFYFYIVKFIYLFLWWNNVLFISKSIVQSIHAILDQFISRYTSPCYFSYALCNYVTYIILHILKSKLSQHFGFILSFLYQKSIHYWFCDVTRFKKDPKIAKKSWLQKVSSFASMWHKSIHG